ncbi:MAG: cyclomaltodextrin glucanotransferase [Cyanothece sp. SIO2G6]|nr:cyclomaltodextrin glucanotransferase [Cyanothece sp. SIO2G6]
MFTFYSNNSLKPVFLCVRFLFSLGLCFFLACAPVSAQPSFPHTRGNLDNDVLYYIVVDRFLDAEPGNNVPAFAFEEHPGDDDDTRIYKAMNRLMLRHTHDPSHRYMGMYWGGDLQGVTQKLDYLKDLGITKIILSPVQDNANGLFYHPNIESYLHQTKFDQAPDDFYRHISTSYHGYWTKDWFAMEEHYQDPEGDDPYQSFRQLLNEAGVRGIGIVLDLTMNQTSPGHISTEPPRLGAGGSLFGESWFTDNGNVYRNGELVATHWDPTTGERDPQGWFHKPMIIWDFDTASQELIENGQISGGMPDLDQSSPQVEQYFLDVARFWLTFNQEQTPIAGFRLDAVKHVNYRFWRKFEDLVISINPHAVLLGEYFSGGYRNPPSLAFLSRTNDITHFDFNFSEAARRFFVGDRGWDGRPYVLKEICLGRQGSYYNASPLQRLVKNVLNPAKTLEIPSDSLDQISDEEAKGWVTFIENHDQPRVRSYYPNATSTDYQSLIKFQFMARGVPLVMYGTETGLAVPYHPDHQGLFGVGGDPFNRPMMIWPDSEGWDDEIYQTLRQMAHLRQQYPLLRYGDTRFLSPKNTDEENDIFMMREAQDADSGQPKILYAYSTSGGDYLLNMADEGITRYEQVGVAQSINMIDGLLALRLEPREAKVLVLF